MGQEAIKARMDPRIVDAMRSARALEESIVMDNEDQYEDEDEQEADIQPDPKRQKTGKWFRRVTATTAKSFWPGH